MQAPGRVQVPLTYGTLPEEKGGSTEMEPKVRGSDASDQTAPLRRVRWLPGILVVLAVLIALLAVGGASSAQSGPEGLLADPTLWATDFCKTYGMVCAVGDFNNDGRDDIVQFNHNIAPAGQARGDVWVRLSNASGFDPATRWLTDFCVNSFEICRVGDFDGRNGDDIITFYRSTEANTNIWVALSNGANGFYDPTSWLTGWCETNEVCDVGDYNGDGRTDVAKFYRNLYYWDLDDPWGKVYVAISNGLTAFNPIGPSSIQHFCMSRQPEVCGSGDFDGDGRDDIVAFSKNSGTIWVALSEFSSDFPPSTTTFGTSAVWNPDKAFCLGGETCGVGDFNNDHKVDVITYLRSTWQNYDPPNIGYVYVAPSDGASFPVETLGLWDPYFCIGSEQCGTGTYIDGVGSSTYSHVSRTGDFNGDGRDDVVTFLRNTNASKPGWVYVKLACGDQFLDVCPSLVSPVNWLPLIMR